MRTDPLSHTSWSRPQTVAGFASSPPNFTLMELARREWERGSRRALDIGCGAGRNAIPLAQAAWDVTGTDLSLPMIEAAKVRAEEAGLSPVPLPPAPPPFTTGSARFLLAPMESLPLSGETFDLIIAHGIWNLAESGARFRRAVREAARLAAPAAALFVFTFSRNTFGPEVEPVEGEDFVFTEFSGSPQCFLTKGQLIRELEAVGFVPDPAFALREHNLPRPGALRTGGPPVIYEALFRHTG